jgi:flagellar basal body-associated protein FliL
MEKKKIIAIILISVIVILSICMIVFRKTIFTQTIKLTFPDGCVEVYKNGVAVTPLCTNGRMLEEQKKNPLLNTIPVIPIK